MNPTQIIRKAYDMLNMQKVPRSSVFAWVAREMEEYSNRRAIELVDMYMDKHLPDKDTPYHYESEIAEGMNSFKDWVESITNQELVPEDLRKEFEIGESVTLDKDLSNSSVVTIVSQTTNKLFTKVSSGQSEWSVMTYRLSRL